MINFYKFKEILNQNNNSNNKLEWSSKDTIWSLYHKEVSQEFLPKIKNMVEEWLKNQKDFQPAPSKEEIYKAIKMGLDHPNIPIY